MFRFHRSWLRLAALAALALLALAISARAGGGIYVLGLLAFVLCAVAAIRIAGDMAGAVCGPEASGPAVPLPTGSAGRWLAGALAAALALAALGVAAQAGSGAGETAGLVVFAAAVFYVFQLIGAAFDARERP